MSETTLLEKLDGLENKFQEISTLITDPAVIADMKRFVKLNKEYSDLERIMKARKEYKTILAHISEAKEISSTSSISFSKNLFSCRNRPAKSVNVTLGA